jgi:hypothetical protein
VVSSWAGVEEGVSFMIRIVQHPFRPVRGRPIHKPVILAP